MPPEVVDLVLDDLEARGMTYCPEAARLGRPIARKPPKGKSHFPLGGFARRTGGRPLTCAFAEPDENPSGGKWDFLPRGLHGPDPRLSGTDVGAGRSRMPGR